MTPYQSSTDVYINLVFFLAEVITLVDDQTRSQILFECAINLEPETLRILKAEIIALRMADAEQSMMQVAA